MDYNIVLGCFHDLLTYCSFAFIYNFGGLIIHSLWLIQHSFILTIGHLDNTGTSVCLACKITSIKITKKNVSHLATFPHAFCTRFQGVFSVEKQ